MLKKYQLNILYWLELCSKYDKDVLNGLDFIVDKKWVLEEDMGDDAEPRYLYTTVAAMKFNLTSKYDNPKSAIEQILIYGYTGRVNDLKNMYFKITTK